MGYILRDVRPNIPRGYMYTLHDIGLVINKLMGGAYRAQYTRRRFRMIYTKVMKKSGGGMHRNSCAPNCNTRYYAGSGGKSDSLTMSLLAETLPANRDTPLFDYPFNELLIWAVLTKRQQMALLMWQHGEEALAKALVALKLYKAMAHEAAEDDLETEVYDELRGYGKEFENIGMHKYKINLLRNHCRTTNCELYVFHYSTRLTGLLLPTRRRSNTATINLGTSKLVGADMSVTRSYSESSATIGASL